MKQQERTLKKSQKHFQRKDSSIKQRKSSKMCVLEKNEIEELIKEDMDLETICERTENKFQEKMKSLKEKKTKWALERNGGAKR